jgi:hypothetical protein
MRTRSKNSFNIENRPSSCWISTLASSRLEQEGPKIMSQLDLVAPNAVRPTHSSTDTEPGNMQHWRAYIRNSATSKPSPRLHEESLVVDKRAELRPAEVVESKLSRMLKDASLPVSHLQMRGLLRSR